MTPMGIVLRLDLVDPVDPVEAEDEVVVVDVDGEVIDEWLVDDENDDDDGVVKEIVDDDVVKENDDDIDDDECVDVIVVESLDEVIVVPTEELEHASIAPGQALRLLLVVAWLVETAIEVVSVVESSEEPPVSGAIPRSPLVKAPPHAGAIEARAPSVAVARRRKRRWELEAVRFMKAPASS
jgi:hypothetical protein